jgi:cobalamin biosynthesis protein CobD/CbiB
MTGSTDMRETFPGPGPAEPRGTPGEREWARKRIERKRKLRGDLVAYVVVNSFLVVAWAITGAGYFWPGWVLAAWGVLLLLDLLSFYFGKPLTEADIDRELGRRR